MNRNPIRNSNGQMSSSVNHYHNQAPPTATLPTATPPIATSPPAVQNTSKVSNSSVESYNLDEILYSGVYKNGRLMHTVTSLIGCLVEVELANGERYEGILNTFSPQVRFEFL